MTLEEFCSRVFASDEEAYEMYKRFGKYHRFGIRKGDYCKDVAGKLVRRMFFCNKEGVRNEKHYYLPNRKRIHKLETRMNCKEKLSIFLDRRAQIWR